jgi:predicted transcriptional regulator
MVKSSPKELPLPTEAELAVLNVLWDKGPVSVREVFDELAKSRSTVFNTTLRVMQRMADKGLIIRDESRKPQRFQPRLTKQQTQSRLVGRLMNRAFDGSARTLVLQALRLNDASAEEIARIEKLLDSMEGGKSHDRD